jgi:hypothetical protein
MKAKHRKSATESFLFPTKIICLSRLSVLRIQEKPSLELGQNQEKYYNPITPSTNINKVGNLKQTWILKWID